MGARSPPHGSATDCVRPTPSPARQAVAGRQSRPQRPPPQRSSGPGASCPRQVIATATTSHPCRHRRCVGLRREACRRPVATNTRAAGTPSTIWDRASKPVAKRSTNAGRSMTRKSVADGSRSRLDRDRVACRVPRRTPERRVRPADQPPSPCGATNPRSSSRTLPFARIRARKSGVSRSRSVAIHSLSSVTLSRVPPDGLGGSDHRSRGVIRVGKCLHHLHGSW